MLPIFCVTLFCTLSFFFFFNRDHAMILDLVWSIFSFSVFDTVFLICSNDNILRTYDS